MRDQVEGFAPDAARFSGPSDSGLPTMGGYRWVPTKEPPAQTWP
jgi:hypothetical protein